VLLHMTWHKAILVLPWHICTSDHRYLPVCLLACLLTCHRTTSLRTLMRRRMTLMTVGRQAQNKPSSVLLVH
jgi:hypothetical protein